MRKCFWFLLLCISFQTLASNVNKDNSTLTTAQFMAALNTCAAGSHVKFDVDLIGSVEGIYNGKISKGKAEINTETEFMKLLPKDKQLEGYRLYVECIKSIFNDPNASKRKVQYSFLSKFTKDTTLAKTIEVFGQPSKVKELYYKNEALLDLDDKTQIRLYRFDGVDISLLIVRSDSDHVFSVGVYSTEHPDKARIPYLTLGYSNDDGSDSWYYNSSDINLLFAKKHCDASGRDFSVHARFGYIVTPVCYFGSPGGYMNYQFVFQPDEDEYSQKCEENITKEWEVDEGICKEYIKLHPVFSLVYFSEDNRGPLGDLPDYIMEWIYNFAQ